jgi:threonine dehydratase
MPAEGAPRVIYWVLVHPFDDLDIIRGQARVGLELLDDVPELAQVIVPVGLGHLRDM